MKLAITQVVLGAVTAVVSGLLVFWYLPFVLFPTEIVEQEGELTRITHVFYVKEVANLDFGLLAVTVLGLAVLGCGVAQLVRAKRTG